MITPDADLELLKDELANIWFTNSGSEKETIGTNGCHASS